MALHPFRIRPFEDDRGDGRRKLLLRLLRRVRLENPRLRFHHLAKCPECDPIAVRERATLAPAHGVARVLVDHLKQLGHESALADPRYPDDGNELRGTILPDPCEGVPEHTQFVGAADHWRSARRGKVHAEPRARIEGFPRRHRLRLALRHYWVHSSDPNN